MPQTIRDRPSELLAVVYSEFDNVSGPVIRCQAPEGFLSQDIFESISDYVITGRQLCGRTIIVTAFDYQILSFPLCIDHEKYNRNTLFFNVSLVVRANTSTTPWEPVVRKIALTFCAMEVESEFLFKPDKKVRLCAVLPRILQDLSSQGECLLHLDDANLLTLRLVPPVKAPPEVGDHEVPVLLREAAVLNGVDWDLALRQVIPHIDGVKYAKRIAMEAEMDEDCVRKALRVLLFYDLIALVDIFQFSNIYVTTEHFKGFVASTSLQSQCCSFVCSNSGGGPGLSPRHVVRLYAAFGPSVTLADILLKHRFKIDKVDPRRLVTFGLVHNFIRRVHRYPVYVRSSSDRRSYGAASSVLAMGQSMATYSPTMGGRFATGGVSVEAPLSSQLAHRVQEKMDGAHTTDQLCVEFMKAFEELEEIAATEDGHIFSVYK